MSAPRPVARPGARPAGWPGGRPGGRPPKRTAAEERSRQVLVAGGIILAVAAIAAAVFWTQSGGGTPVHPPLTPRVSAPPGALVLGPVTRARGSALAATRTPDHTVVVRDSFGCGPCRIFELRSRDFLSLDAAMGLVRVRYEQQGGTRHPGVRGVADVLAMAGPQAALTMRNLAFDPAAPPAAGSLPVMARAAGLGPHRAASVGSGRTSGAIRWLAGVGSAPGLVVILDGRRLTGSPAAIADGLERALARGVGR